MKVAILLVFRVEHVKFMLGALHSALVGRSQPPSSSGREPAHCAVPRPLLPKGIYVKRERVY
jgi:hypothetical protein